MKVDELKKQRAELETKIGKTEGMIGKGLSWKDGQYYLEKYKEEMRVLDEKMARLELGEDTVAELRKKKAQLKSKIQSLEGLRKSGDISERVFKEKKKQVEREIQQVEKDIVDTM